MRLSDSNVPWTDPAAAGEAVRLRLPGHGVQGALLLHQSDGVLPAVARELMLGDPLEVA